MNLAKDIEDLLDKTYTTTYALSELIQPKLSYSIPKLLKIFKKCHGFIKEMCLGRDESHSETHLLLVTYNALNITHKMMLVYNEKISFDMLEEILICAILHDVADYKYDKDKVLYKELYGFIEKICDDFEIVSDPNDLIWIIDYLSFSKEKKAGSLQNLIKETYPKSELSNKLKTIRNIVADADRLEAIGKIGAERCIQYGYHAYPDADIVKLRELVKKHAEEKLYILPFGDPETKEPYFHTAPGKDRALTLHEDTVKYIEKFVAGE